MPRAFWTFPDQCFVHIWIFTKLAGIFSLSNDCVVGIEMRRRRENNRILWPKTYINAQHSTVFSVCILLLRRWHASVLSAKNRLVEKLIWRHVISKHHNPGLTQFSNSSNVFTEMSGGSLQASFYLHDCRNNRVWKNGLGSISITTSFRRNLPSPWEDRLILFTMATCVYRNASRNATHSSREFLQLWSRIPILMWRNNGIWSCLISDNWRQ